MSQSKLANGVRTPKHSARSRREQPTKQEATDETTVEPACRTREVGRGVKKREWRTIAYNGSTRVFFEPCKWCFPDGAPDETEFETVVRSCREPTAYHRQRNDTSSNEREHQTDSTEPRDQPQISQTSQEPIESITDLRVGQWIGIEYWDHPLYVIKATTETDGTVAIRGPSGGEYQIEGRPKCPQPYYGPKTGYLSEIIRIHIETPLEAV